MDGYTWFAVAGLIVCLLSLSYHLGRLIREGKPKDYSKPLGSTSRAIRYSFTGAMNPGKKESAFLHLPTYTAGMIYHIGTFLSTFLFFLFLLQFEPGEMFQWTAIPLLIASTICGFGILVKRFLDQNLRSLSNPDDYLSNFLVSCFQLMTILMLYNPRFAPAYFIITGILLFYLPLGKLRHVVYFFAARYHLGYFYGWRGSWPPDKKRWK